VAPPLPCRSSTGAIRQRRRQARSTSASPPHSLAPTPRCRSPSCVPAVASAPPRSMSGSPCSPTPAASSKPRTDIASPTADPKTSDNQRPDFPVPVPGLSTTCGNGNWEVHASAAISAARPDRNPLHSLVRPCGAFSRPGRSISMPSRTAAVKTGPVQGRRRLGLDGREHDGTLARHGHGRSPLRSMTLDRRAR
jgi:hypothetical protein